MILSLNNNITLLTSICNMACLRLMDWSPSSTISPSFLVTTCCFAGVTLYTRPMKQFNYATLASCRFRCFSFNPSTEYMCTTISYALSPCV